jgi:CheY-like chemotaxis protein
VRAWRSRRSFSQEELAERAALHRTYISDVERGVRNVSLGSIQRLADALTISIATLFPAELHDAKLQSQLADGEAEQLVDILLVQANPTELNVTLSTFQQARLGNRIHAVATGAEALDYLFCTGKYKTNCRAAEHPQVVLLDLPKIERREVIQRIKADKRTAQTQVVLLTESADKLNLAACRQLGADCFMVKPIDFQQLCAVTPQLNLGWALLKLARSSS